MKWHISDYLLLVSLVMGAIGGLFAFFQWRKNISLRRADYINVLIEKIRTDDIIKEIFYMIEYSQQHWYNEKFHQSTLEVKVDKCLSYFSYICYLKAMCLITKREYKFFEYEIN
jgi:hypothetical protein